MLYGVFQIGMRSLSHVKKIWCCFVIRRVFDIV